MSTPSTPSTPSTSTPRIALHRDDVSNLPPALADIVNNTTYRQVPASEASTHINPALRQRLSADPTQVLTATTSGPYSVDVEAPAIFRAHEPAVVAHEATHEWQLNLPPSEQAAIPPDDTSSVPAMYDISHVATLRAQGKTMKDLPKEEAASIVQNYIEHPAMRAKLQPWIDDLENTPLSALEPTPKDKQLGTLGAALWQRFRGLIHPETINTTPRPPGPPPSYALHTNDIANIPPSRNRRVQ